MAEISIFQDEAFGVDALLTVINEDHVLPGQIAAAGLFEEQGVSGTVVQIEKDGMTLALVKSAPRGSTGQVVTGNKRNSIPFNTVHLPETFQILADEIQGIRAVGSVTELMQVQAYVARRVEKARRQLDLTHEFQRIGAIKGKRNAAVPMKTLVNHLFIALLPAITVVLIMGGIYLNVTAPIQQEVAGEVVAMGGSSFDYSAEESDGGLAEPGSEDGLQPPPT